MITILSSLMFPKFWYSWWGQFYLVMMAEFLFDALFLSVVVYDFVSHLMRV